MAVHVYTEKEVFGSLPSLNETTKKRETGAREKTKSKSLVKKEKRRKEMEKKEQKNSRLSKVQGVKENVVEKMEQVTTKRSVTAAGRQRQVTRLSARPSTKNIHRRGREEVNLSRDSHVTKRTPAIVVGAGEARRNQLLPELPETSTRGKLVVAHEVN